MGMRAPYAKSKAGERGTARGATGPAYTKEPPFQNGAALLKATE